MLAGRGGLAGQAASRTALDIFSGTVITHAATPARKSACSAGGGEMDCGDEEEGKRALPGGGPRRRRQTRCERRAWHTGQAAAAAGTARAHGWLGRHGRRPLSPRSGSAASQPACSWHAHYEPLSPLVASQPADAGQERLEPGHPALRHLALERAPRLPAAVHGRGRARAWARDRQQAWCSGAPWRWCKVDAAGRRVRSCLGTLTPSFLLLACRLVL